MDNGNNHGLQTLEQMNLDRGDDTHNFDPFYNPLSQGSNNNMNNGMELQASNQFMGKQTAERQTFWSPENEKAQKQQERKIIEQVQNDVDDLDDLEEIQDNSK